MWNKIDCKIFTLLIKLKSLNTQVRIKVKSLENLFLHFWCWLCATSTIDHVWNPIDSFSPIKHSRTAPSSWFFAHEGRRHPETGKLRELTQSRLTAEIVLRQIVKSERRVCHVLQRGKRREIIFLRSDLSKSSDRFGQSVRIIKSETSTRVCVRVYIRSHVCGSEDIHCSEHAISSSFRVFAAVTMAVRKNGTTRFSPKLLPISP